MRRALLLCALAGFGVGTRAAQPPVDAELLEFLGSIDSDDDSWQEYLEKKPVKPAARQAAKQPPPKQEPKTPPPRQSEEKKVQDK